VLDSISSVSELIESDSLLLACHPPSLMQCLEVLVTLRRELERRQLLRLPRVHVSPSLGAETQRLREYVRRLQGNLAERPGGEWGAWQGLARCLSGGLQLAVVLAYLQLQPPVWGLSCEARHQQPSCPASDICTCLLLFVSS
jgi:hypothetical protein